MLYSKVSDCKECADILPLIDAINCKLYEASSDIYNNVAYGLNLRVPATDLLDLLNYKRILTYKYINMDYACEFTVEQIANRVRILTAGCAKCVYKEPIYPLFKTTTTTTTCGVSYRYNVTTIVCGICLAIAPDVILYNTNLLTVNKFYYNPASNSVIYISSYLGCSNTAPTVNILDSDKQNTCEAVVCPTTTTTTVAPTTTTTTTVANTFNFNTGSSNSTTACGLNTFPLKRYATGPVLGTGIFIYTDPAKTIPMDGQNLWYKALEAPQTQGFRIDPTGGINAVFGCPTTTTTTTGP